MLAHFLATDAVARALAAAPRVEINTDDRNVVEFGLARSVGRPASNLVADVRQLARSLGASRPALDSDAGIDWPAVDTAWLNFLGWSVRSDPAQALPADEQLRQAALRRYFQAEDPAGAREIWRQVSGPPRDPWELAMAADLEAEAGSNTAVPLIEQLRVYQPAEADTLLATVRTRQSRLGEAASALASAFARYRVDPWPLLKYKQKALTLAAEVGGTDPATARGLFDALQQPFSVRSVDDMRVLTSAELSTKFDFRGECRGPIGALEPHAPWASAFLTMRRDCYAASLDPRLAAATRDLADFFSHEPLPLVPR